MSETQPEQALKELIDGQEPERAMLALLQWQFIKLAELDGTVNAIMPVLGLISKRLGISNKELDCAFDEYAAGHGMSCEPVDGHSSGLAGDEGAGRPLSFTLRAPGRPVACSERRSNVIHRGYPSVYRPVT